jgi:hypothetical protein
VDSSHALVKGCFHSEGRKAGARSMKVRCGYTFVTEQSLNKPDIHFTAQAEQKHIFVPGLLSMCSM